MESRIVLAHRRDLAEHHAFIRTSSACILSVSSVLSMRLASCVTSLRSDLQHLLFDRQQMRRMHRELPQAEAEQHTRQPLVAGHLAAHRDRHAGFVARRG